MLIAAQEFFRSGSASHAMPAQFSKSSIFCGLTITEHRSEISAPK